MAEKPVALNDEEMVAYVRGRLPADGAARIATLAAEEPTLAAGIALARGLAADVDREAREPAPGALGWARIARALDAEAPPRPARHFWPMAAAAAAAVLVWQIVAVPLLPEPGQYRPVTEAPGPAPEIVVAFAPTATEGAIRALLREVGAEVVGGPTAVGLWRLGFADAAARDAALVRLGGDGLVESAQAE